MKWEFFLSCNHVSTAVWLDFNEMLEEEVRWELHKDVTGCFEKSWKQHPTKQQLYGHLPPISQTIPDKQNMLGTAREVRQTHKWCSSMDSYT